MGNWMEKFERRKDEQRELELKARLEQMLNNLENKSNLNDTKKMRILEKIVEIYHDLELEICEFDRDDYKKKRQELEILRGIVANKEHSQEKESESWNQYKDEELKNDADYEEDIDEER